MKRQFWLAELDRYENPDLIDGPHSDRSGAEKALTLRKALPMLKTEGRKFAVAEVILTDPTGLHEEINHKAVGVIVRNHFQLNQSGESHE